MSDNVRMDSNALLQGFHAAARRFKDELSKSLKRHRVDAVVMNDLEYIKTFDKRPEGIYPYRQRPLDYIQKRSSKLERIFIFISRPSDQAKVAELMRHDFWVESYTQSYSYSELNTPAPNATRKMTDCYIVAFTTILGYDESQSTWHFQVNLISEPPTMPQFQPKSQPKIASQDFQAFVDDDYHRRIRVVETGDALKNRTRPRGEIEDVDYILSGWLHKKTWLRSKMHGSSEMLSMFLKAHHSYFPHDFRAMLGRHLSTISKDDYLNVEKEYACVKPLPLSIFIVDRVLLVEEIPTGLPEEVIEEAQNTSEAYIYQLRITLSTIVWATELFSIEYYKNFRDAQKDPLARSFKWLSAPKQDQFLRGEQQLLEDRDVPYLNELWRWFHQHPSRQIKFAMALSKNGLIRERKDAMSILEEFIWNSAVPSGKI